MFRAIKLNLFSDDSLENTFDVAVHYLKLCFDVCCSSEIIFVTSDRFTSPKLNEYGEKPI